MAPTSLSAVVMAAFSSSSRSRSLSAALIAVMSRAIFDAPMIIPEASQTSEMVSDTSIACPSRLSLTVWK